jgi:hypothetical protein
MEICYILDIKNNDIKNNDIKTSRKQGAYYVDSHLNLCIDAGIGVLRTHSPSVGVQEFC